MSKTYYLFIISISTDKPVQTGDNTDQMLQNVTSALGLHCLPLTQQFLAHLSESPLSPSVGPESSIICRQQLVC